MMSEQVHPFDAETVAMFAEKGVAQGFRISKEFNRNGLKVRRVMQLIRDLARKPFDQLRILDLACGEGVYAIEAALRGADVTAIDARNERMRTGAEVAAKLGLSNLQFQQADVRAIRRDTHGEADVILFLGILYHLDAPEATSVLTNLSAMCRQFVVIDTHFAPRPTAKVEIDGRGYEGKRFREHGSDDAQAVRQSRLLMSLDTPVSFAFTKESLFRLLHDAGFTSVCECTVPFEPTKPADRITLIAAKGDPVRVSAFPWVNDKPEDELARLVIAAEEAEGRKAPPPPKPKLKRRMLAAVNRLLRRAGLELRRV